MTGNLTRREATETRKEKTIDDEAGSGVMHLQVKEQQGLPAIPEAKAMAQILPKNF